MRYTVVTYKDPVAGQAIEEDQRTDLDARDAREARELCKEWFTPEQAKAILSAVGKLGVWLGIGRRGSQIVKHWRNDHPWLPEVTFVSDGEGEGKRILAIREADAAPLLWETLYPEVQGMKQLLDLTLPEKPEIQIESFIATPSWRHPSETVEDVAMIPELADDKLEKGPTYHLENVKLHQLKTLIEKLIDQFLGCLDNVNRNPLGTLEKDTSQLKADYDGLCGAWYRVEVQTVGKHFHNGQDKGGLGGPKTDRLLVRIPVGVIAQGANPKEHPFTMVPWATNEVSKAFTAGLDVRFMCRESGRVYPEDWLSADTFWLNSRLNKPGAWVVFDPSLGKLKMPFDKMRKEDTKDFWNANGAARLERAKQLAPRVVGDQPLAVFTVDGTVHLLETKDQVAAWCAQNPLLEKLAPTRFELFRNAKVLRIVPFATTDIGNRLDSALPDEMQNISANEIPDALINDFTFPRKEKYEDNPIANNDPSVFRLRLIDAPIGDDEVAITLRVLTGQGEPIKGIAKQMGKDTATSENGIEFKLKRKGDAWVSPYLRVATTKTDENKTDEFGIIHSLPPKDSAELDHAKQFGRILRVEGESAGVKFKQDFQLGGRPYARIPVKFFWVGDKAVNEKQKQLALNKLANLNQWWAGQGLEFSLFDRNNPIEQRPAPSRTLISIGDFTGKRVVSNQAFTLTINLKLTVGDTDHTVAIRVDVPAEARPDDVANQIEKAVASWQQESGALSELRLGAKTYIIETPRYFLMVPEFDLQGGKNLTKVGLRGPADVEIIAPVGVDKLEIQGISVGSDVKVDIHVPPVKNPYHEAMFLPPAAATRHWVRAFSSPRGDFVAIVVESGEAEHFQNGSGFPHKLCENGFCCLYEDEGTMKKHFAETLEKVTSESRSEAVTLLNFGLWEEPGAGFIMFIAQSVSQPAKNDIQHEMGHVLADLDHPIENPDWFYKAELLHNGGPSPERALQISRHKIYVGTVSKKGNWQRTYKSLAKGYGGAVRQSIKKRKSAWLVHQLEPGQPDWEVPEE